MKDFATTLCTMDIELSAKSANLISHPVTLIYNSSMKSVIFLYYWTMARIAPIFKSGKRCGSSNNRAILMLSVFSRVLQRIVQDQLHEFLRANCILTNNQYAFRTLCSMVVSLLNSTEYWLQNADNQKLNMTIFLDDKRVFHTVDHRTSIDKLMKYSIKGIEWFKSYQNGRKQFCTADGQKSRTEKSIAAFLKDHTQVPFSSLYNLTTLRVAYDSLRQTSVLAIHKQQLHLLI